MEVHTPLSRSTLGSVKFVRGGFHDLTHNQKQVRHGICQGLLHRYEREGNIFLHRIVTCESRAHHYTPESKTASMEWRRWEHCPVKAKTRLSPGKVLTTIFWDW
jgi:hypothetical protein